MIRPWLRRLVFPLGALGVFALAACSTRPPALKSEGALAVTLSEAKKSTAVAAQLFNLVTITLPAPHAPGYQWQISFHDTRYLQQKTEIRPAPPGGAGPTVAFIARVPGRTRLRFILVPDGGARVVNPVDQQELVLTIE